MQIKMKYYGIVLLSLLWIEAVSQVPATPLKDVPGFRARLETLSDKVSTIESDFIQEKNLSVLANTIVSRGHFWYKKENNIRWEYLSPYKYLIIITNNQIYIKEDKSQKQYDIQSNTMFREMNKFISGCIQGDILKNEQEYRVGYFEDDKSYFVILVPHDVNMRKMLNEVQIWFDKRDLTVSRINMVEAGGDYTKIEFTSKRLNTDIPIEKFDFK